MSDDKKYAINSHVLRLFRRWHNTRKKIPPHAMPGVKGAIIRWHAYISSALHLSPSNGKSRTSHCQALSPERISYLFSSEAGDQYECGSSGVVWALEQSAGLARPIYCGRVEALLQQLSGQCSHWSPGSVNVVMKLTCLLMTICLYLDSHSAVQTRWWTFYGQ